MTSTVHLAMDAVLETESGGYDLNAVPDGDGGKAVGPYQMWPIAVREANRIAGKQIWTLADRRDLILSRAMCRVTLEYHYKRGVTDPVDLACRWRNPNGNAPAWHREKIRRAVANIVNGGKTDA